MDSHQDRERIVDSEKLLLQNVRPNNWSNPDPAAIYHLVVIGAGTAGLVAAAGAAGLGAKVALVERHKMGGDCLNTGCVPSKSWIAAAKKFHQRLLATDPKSRSEASDTAFLDAIQDMQRVRAGLSRHDSAERFRSLGVDVFFGEGKFLDGSQLEVAGRKLRFKKAILATGARATVPDIPGLNDSGYLTNENVFELKQRPKSLAILGGGPIGCELAQLFARFGTEVTLIHRNKSLLNREAPDASLIAANALERAGVKILTSSQVKRVSRAGENRVLQVETRDGAQEVQASQVLLSIGRTPNIENLGLQEAGVEIDSRGGLVVNDFLQTTNRRVYASGDVIGGAQFTHAADFMSRTVLRNALFFGRARLSQLLIPRCTYIDPEIAHVGIDPQSSTQELQTYELQLTEVDRAVVDQETEGFVRVYCRKGSDRLVGATVVGPHAGDLISELTLAIQHRIRLGKIASTIHPYPTYADAIRRLGDQYNRTRLTPWSRSILRFLLRFA